MKNYPFALQLIGARIGATITVNFHRANFSLDRKIESIRAKSEREFNKLELKFIDKIKL